MRRMLAAICALVMMLAGGGVLAAGNAMKVVDIVTADNLQAQVPWLESQIGPAFKINGNIRTYKIEGCKIDVIAEQEKIQGFAVDVSDACAFDLRSFTGSPDLPAPRDLTFGSFEEQAGRAQYFADCLSLCGNAFDPSVYAFRAGSHADNYINVMLEVVLVDDGVIDASFKWADAMKAKEGEAYVIETKFNCDSGKYSDIARDLFKALKPTRISVGNIRAPKFNTDCPK